MKKVSSPEVLELENEVLQEENEKLKTAIRAKKADTADIGCEFTYKNKKYEFVVAAFRHDGENITAEEVRKNLNIQKFLVESESGLIREVK